MNDRKSFKALGSILFTIVIFSASAFADPPAAFQSTNPNVPAVTGDASLFEGVRGVSHAPGHGGVTGFNLDSTTDAGPGVFGSSDNGEGVRGVSKSDAHGAVVGTNGGAAEGVFGESARGEGVRGVSHSGAHGAVVGTNDAGVGVFGASGSGSAAGGEFQNTGGGDLLRAGQSSAFRVLNNGDVIVRGQRIGATGIQGPQGLQGPPGPAVHTVSVCQSPALGSGTCPCSGATVSRVSGTCSVTSDTGQCSNSIAGGCCAVCRP
jgi:hypothetical protein